MNKMNNMSIMEQFENYRLNIKGQSEKTVEGYLKDLKLFFNHINFNIEELTVEQLQSINELQLEEFISYCKNERENSASACNRKVCSLKAFFEFCYDKMEYIKKDPSRRLEKMRLPKRVPIYLNEQEQKDFMEVIDENTTNGLRDKCLLSILKNCGLRVSELSNLKISDINGDEIIITGKGDKQRVVIMNESCKQIFEKYLNEKRLLEDVESEWLFLNKRKQQLGTQTIERIVKKIAKECGLDKHITPHKLRHTCATSLRENGVDLLTIQKILGHESISTTQIYTHVDMRDVRDAVRKIG